MTVNATVNFDKCRSLVVQTASPGYKVISCSRYFINVCVCVGGGGGGGGDEGRHRVVV